MKITKLLPLLLLFSLGCSESKPSAPAKGAAPEKDSRVDQAREDEAALARSRLRVPPSPEEFSLEQLTYEAGKVDAFLAKHKGTKAAQEFEQWRARASEVLKQWDAEDRKARAAPVRVPLATLLSQYRAKPEAANDKYAGKWLIVTGKITKVTKVLVKGDGMDGTANVVLVKGDERVVLQVHLQDKAGSGSDLLCTSLIPAQAGPGQAAGGKSMASVKEGDTVTVLGKWPTTRPKRPPALVRNNLKQLAPAVNQKGNTYDKLPSAKGMPWRKGQLDASSPGSLQYYLLPYLEARSLYGGSPYGLPWGVSQQCTLINCELTK